MSISNAINNAARDLPEGWQVKIVIEKNGYAVELVSPSCREVEVDQVEPGIENEINEAVSMAKFIDSTYKKDLTGNTIV